MRSSPPRAVLRRRADAPFAGPAVALFLAGAAGMLAQSGLAGPLEAALGSPAPALVGCILALVLGTGLGAVLARVRHRTTGQHFVAPAEILGLLAAAELALPHAWAWIARGPLVARALVGGLLMFLPSLGTGALLPVLARRAAREVDGSRRVALLFAAAFAGGAVGAALAAGRYAPRAGLAAAVPAAALVTAIAAVISFLVSWRWRTPGDAAAPARKDRRREGPSPLAMGSVALGFLGGGVLLAIAHVVRIATGDAADLLPASLAGTLLGLAAGSAHARTLLLHYRETALVRALCTTGLVVAASTIVMGALPAGGALLGSFLRTPADAAILHVLIAAAAAALPAAWIGASFQLLVPHLKEDLVGEAAARSAGAGTAGATLGAAFVGIVLLPLLGAQKALIALALGFSALALGLAWRGRARRSVLLTALTTVVVVVVLPRWDLARAAFGRDAAGPATWAREGVSAGVVATDASGAVATNGRVQGPTLDDEAVARLAAALAPNLASALAPDDLGIAAAILGVPWERVTIPRVPPSWHAHLSAPLRAAAEDPRATPAQARGLAGSRAAASAVIVSLPTACGPGCAADLARNARDALAPDGVALIVVRDPEPVALAALLRATRAAFPHAALAITRARATVIGGRATLEPPPQRLDALAARTPPIDARAALADVVAYDAGVDACAEALTRRGDTSPAGLRTCASAAQPRAQAF